MFYLRVGMVPTTQSLSSLVACVTIGGFAVVVVVVTAAVVNVVVPAGALLDEVVFVDVVVSRVLD